MLVGTSQPLLLCVPQKLALEAAAKGEVMRPSERRRQQLEQGQEPGGRSNYSPGAGDAYGGGPRGGGGYRDGAGGGGGGYRDAAPRDGGGYRDGGRGYGGARGGYDDRRGGGLAL